MTTLEIGSRRRYESSVETAAKVLIVGGTLNLAAAFILGFVFSNVLLKRAPADLEEPPYLRTAHSAALWEGFMLLGLVFAVELSPLSSTLETLAAWLLVAASALQVASSVVNWRQGVKDQFVNKPIGFVFATVNAVLASIGLLILVVGVFKGL